MESYPRAEGIEVHFFASTLKQLALLSLVFCRGEGLVASLLWWGALVAEFWFTFLSDFAAWFFIVYWRLRWWRLAVPAEKEQAPRPLPTSNKVSADWLCHLSLSRRAAFTGWRTRQHFTLTPRGGMSFLPPPSPPHTHTQIFHCWSVSRSRSTQLQCAASETFLYLLMHIFKQTKIY